MSFDPVKEPPITLKDAAALPLLRTTSGEPVPYVTLQQWVYGSRKGRLGMIRIGRTLYTSEAAVRRFIETRPDAVARATGRVTQ